MPFEVSQHYNCKFAGVTTVHHTITPTWHRVSQSPWDAKADKTAGYGRPILRCAISDDMPVYFPRTEHLKRPEDIKPLPKENFAASASIQASLVLPGATSTLASRPAHGNRVRRLIDGKRIIYEPYQTPRNKEKFFQWNSKEPRNRPPEDTSRTTARAGNGWRSARPASSHGYERAFPSSRIASARSTGRRDGSANNRKALASR